MAEHVARDPSPHAATPSAAQLSVEEQQIIAEIQELQRHLRELKADQDEQEVPEVKEKARPRRVLIVANRLPIRCSRDARTGRWSFDDAPGGLATALRGISMEVQFVWVGWVGCDVPPQERARVAERLMREHGCFPVFLEPQLVENYYNGFCNDVLWPLFHYVPLPMYQAGAEKKFDAHLWDAYTEANRRFAEAVMEGADVVWVHDYHLMRLPLELRRLDPRVAVAWFLHTPFPSSEIYRILPYRRELLEGLLHADLVGFHTYDYARHFLSACSRVLDVSTTTPKGIEFGGRFCSIGVFPIGIDPLLIRNTLRSRAVKKRTGELGDTFEGRKIIIGVDRLDYIKGMPHKLLAFELFLSRNPSWVGKVTLIQVGVPTRVDVAEYQTLAKHVNELVGRINGYSPIHYINQSIPQDELIAIYHLADACLVTSVRDGMNLVSHEYVAAQEDPFAKDGPGALVLSEFAGSAQSLSGAIRVNPWNTEELARAIHEALTLTRVERELRWAKLHRYVTTNTASYWARSFVSEFRDVCEHPPLLSKLPKLNAAEFRSLVGTPQTSGRIPRRLVVTDYDGTLTQIQSLPQLATPAPVVTQLLATLARDTRNTVYVMSGRERRFMDKWLGKLKVGLAAEFGYCHRAPDDEQGVWKSLGRELDTSWKDVVRPIMQYFAERTPGTYIESKESSLAWHYRDADPHFGAWQAKDMQIHMEDVMSNLPLEIIQGNRLVEVRHVGVNKSLVLEEVLRMGPRGETADVDFDFVLCVGDDRSDEDMYQLLKAWHARRAEHDADKGGDDAPAQLYLVHIGTGATQAEYYLESVIELRKLLRGMASISLRDLRGAPRAF
ncbi:hypothetical protein AURANDRAFT_70085 [Aureococcus anophagefferens]|uniref:Uncharacterized protein n=1 Tax=Aureococcus anophagefferens TaxID=44056 RepID=F0Y2I9_AURAN|nr:hypothetical protein AURANDRAFT_70085 [Aureococcus anophagefferens]EGB10711.1 hypothetical protein AURANDRAFT_70085 [Aureococcus anophagefferens]|eukprot:XP_009034302.1 hypothetical protein AURANDRAFT_70085 [Aureococcus anophagefferens]